VGAAGAAHATNTVNAVDLGEQLREQHITTVILAGIATNGLVLSTNSPAY
jgi:nicotinamidase-related amidase